MLSGREEKGPIDEWVSIKNAHQRVTKHTGHFVQLVTGQIGQDKDAGLVVANAAFILHFDVVRVDFLLRQNIKGAVIHSPRENTAARIMSVKKRIIRSYNLALPQGLVMQSKEVVGAHQQQQKLSSRILSEE